MSCFASIFLLLLFVNSPAVAHPMRLDSLLEKEIIIELQKLGPDSWEESGKEIKFTQIFFDQTRSQLIIFYQSQSQSQSQNQAPTRALNIKISSISSLKDILVKGPNGVHYLNSKITDTLFTSL